METSETSPGTGFVAPEDGDHPTVSIVVPAFNEAGRIAETVRKIATFVRQSPLAIELIVVDDGSTDRTSEIVRRLGAHGLRLIRNDENHGNGDTVLQGVLAAF